MARAPTVSQTPMNRMSSGPTPATECCSRNAVGPGSSGAWAVQRDDRAVLPRGGSLEDAALPDHPREAARRVGAATEPEEKELVPELVIADQEAIRVVDVRVEPDTERAAEQPIQDIAGPH